MEKKNEDDRNEEREQLTQQQQTNKLSFHRPLSNCLSIDYQINKNSRHKTSTNNDHHYPPIILPSERTSLPMKSSTLPQYTSNPSLINTKSKQQYIDDQSTYSVSHQTNKLPHAKSYGELYQSSTTFSISSPVKKINEENKTKQHETSTVLTPVKMRVPVTTVTNSTEQSQSSPSNKIPFWKRFKKMIVPTKRTKDQQTSTSSKIPTLLLDELIDNQSNLTITDSVQAKLLHNPLKLSELKTWINSQIFPEDQIRAEYDKLPTESLYPKTVALQTENRSKNRFNSIEPYDHSRVILKTLPNDSTSDYINASYIDGYQTNRMYIAAQAPTDATLGDFIRMIWQLRIQSIVMLTRLFEDGKHKSVQYWPDQGQKQVNNFQINLDNEEKYAFYTIRRMTISNRFESSDILIVNHYHFLSWPDHDCVSLPTPLLEFRQRFHTDSKSSLPILVHCSAGVGRSGTFIALDTLLEMSQTAEIIDILEFTHRMRQNRVYMIQTADQYVFLYRALIEGILTEQTSISLKEFMITRKVHMDIKDQYKLLEQLQSNIRFSYHSALDPQNFNKNRFENILAPDNNRPYLMTQIDKTTDYINAVFVNSYRHISNYIVTQYPLPNTLVDFWRLVYDHKISIIMLIEPIARDSKTPVYWPLTTSQNVTIGPFEIVLNSQKEDDSLIEHIFHLNYQTKNSNIQLFDRQRTIRQFQVKDSSRLLSIVKRFLKEMKTRSEQNVLIQCLNGVTWSGYFIALCNAIDQMQTEQIIDPFKTVRLLRSNREQFINQNQYENLFVSMIDYAQQYLSI